MNANYEECAISLDWAKNQKNRRPLAQTRRKDVEGTESLWEMKHLLLTTIAAVLLVGSVIVCIGT